MLLSEQVHAQIYDVHVRKNGDKHWRLNGKYHREDGPAIECKNGNKSWYRNGKKHREDGPAVVNNGAKGGKYWYRNGKKHREDGPAVEGNNGYKAWYLNGKKIKEQKFKGESEKTYKVYVENNNTKVWYLDGKLHREDGPAIELGDGTANYWYLNGENLTEEEHERHKEWYLNGEKPTKYENKEVEIDGKKYKLISME